MPKKAQKVRDILVSEIGCIAVTAHAFVVYREKKIMEGGLEMLIQPRYFGTIAGAIEELRETFQVKELLKGQVSRDLRELINKVDAANKKWDSFYNEKQLKKAENYARPDQQELL